MSALPTVEQAVERSLSARTASVRAYQRYAELIYGLGGQRFGTAAEIGDAASVVWRAESVLSDALDEVDRAVAREANDRAMADAGKRGREKRYAR